MIQKKAREIREKMVEITILDLLFNFQRPARPAQSFIKFI